MKERAFNAKPHELQSLLAGCKTQHRWVMSVQPSEHATVTVEHYHPTVIDRNGDDEPGAEIFGAWWADGDVGLRCPYGQPGDKEWQSGPLPRNGYYKVRGLLAESLGGDDRAVFVNAKYFNWGFSENDDPEAIELDTDITRGNVQWKRPGDRLWVREPFFAWGRWETRLSTKKGHDHRREWHFIDMTLESGKSYLYVTKLGSTLPQSMGGKVPSGEQEPTWWKRPATHLPRAASRITLEITGVRVERLRDISDANAIAEGVTANGADIALMRAETMGKHELKPYASAYQMLWALINGAESWAANPWVWVVEFKRVESDTEKWKRREIYQASQSQIGSAK